MSEPVWVRIAATNGKWHRVSYSKVHADPIICGLCGTYIGTFSQIESGKLKGTTDLELPPHANRCQQNGCLTAAERLAKPARVKPKYTPPEPRTLVGRKELAVIEAARVMVEMLERPGFRGTHRGRILHELQHEWPSLLASIRDIQKAVHDVPS